MLGLRNIALKSSLSGQSRKPEYLHVQFVKAVFLRLLSDMAGTMDQPSQCERFFEISVTPPSLIISKLIVISSPEMPPSFREK